MIIIFIITNNFIFRGWHMTVKLINWWPSNKSDKITSLYDICLLLVTVSVVPEKLKVAILQPRCVLFLTQIIIRVRAGRNLSSLSEFVMDWRKGKFTRDRTSKCIMVFTWTVLKGILNNQQVKSIEYSRFFIYMLSPYKCKNILILNSKLLAKVEDTIDHNKKLAAGTFARIA